MTTVAAALIAFAVGFLVARQVYAWKGRHYERLANLTRAIAEKLALEASRHKGGKISPHVAKWAIGHLSELYPEKGP